MNYIVHISFKSFDNLHIETSITKILQINNYLKKLEEQKNGEYYEKVVSLPTLKKKFTVLRSPHIDKKSREQFEWTRYRKSIFLDFREYSHFSVFLFLLKNGIFPGVQVEINLKHSTFYNTM
jgi:small subunit ribosomal protein S10